MRVSSAAVERADVEISLVRDATVISYGAQADGIVTIAIRTAVPAEAGAVRASRSGC